MQRHFFTFSVLFLFLVSFFLLNSAFTQKTYNQTIKTELLVVGGGASGVASAIQAARNGIDVVLVEPTPWLGGMLTSAGVSAIDGNHNLPSGIWGEFREKLREYYGGAEALSTGWVSHTLFEPHAGNNILNQMLDEYPSIQRLHGLSLIHI